MEEKRNSWISVGIKLVLGLGLLFLILIAILHIPEVQTKLANTITNSVIKKSGGSVKIKRSTFDIYRGVQLEEVLLADADQDTLITIQQVAISPRSTLLSLVRDLSFNDLNVSGIHLYYKRKENQNQSNWQKFIASMGSEDNESNDAQSILLSNIQLYDVMVDYEDDHTQTYIHGAMEGLEIEIDQIDSSLISLERFIVIAPSLSVDRPEAQEGPESSADTTGTGSGALLLPQIEIGTFSLIDANLQGLLRQENGELSRELKNLDLMLQDMSFNGINDWSAQVEDISAENGRYNLQHLGIRRIAKTEEEFIIDDIFARVGSSYLDVDVEVRDVGDIAQLLEGRAMVDLRTSKIKLADFFDLFPDLKREFGDEPLAQKYIQLDGHYEISKNNVIAEQIRIWINGRHFFQGSGIFSRSGAVKESLLNFEVTKLRTDLTALDADVKRIKIPEEFKRLGPIDFSGTFDGFLNDFVAQGELLTDLGEAKMDIQFDLYRNNPDSMAYSGYLELNDFNLAGLLANEDFGNVSMKMDIRKGIGERILSSSASLGAVIEQFQYKGFDYRDAVFDGFLSSQTINGQFGIKDPNLDFEFDGIVDFSQEEPLFDFKIEAEKIDFCQLNLIDFPCQISFSSDINVQGKSLKNIYGLTSLENIHMVHDSSELTIKSLKIGSERRQDESMLFTLNSDFAYAEIEGQFNLFKMHEGMIRHIIQNHQSHFDQTKIEDNYGELPDMTFRYDLRVRDVEPILDFLKVDLDIAERTRISGEYRPERSFVSLAFEAPKVEYKDITATEVYMQLVSNPNQGELKLRTDSFSRGNTIEIDELSIVSQARNDDLFLRAFVFQDSLNSVELETKSTVDAGGGYFTQFLYDDIIIDSTIWTILPNRGVGIYPKRIDIEQFVLTDGKRSIGLRDYQNKGLDVSLNEFNFELINPIINYDKLYFSGYANANFRIDDIYARKGLEGYLEVPDFGINGDAYGRLRLDADHRLNSNIVDVQLGIVQDSQQLHVKGYYDTELNYVDANLDMQKYPLAFLEYIIDEGISETTGLADIDLEIKGPTSDMTMDGYGYVNDAGVKIDYIGAYYRMDDERLKIDDQFIDFNGVRLIDEMDNVATISGGLRHDFLADFRADLEISSPKFIALNTTKDDNELYYGTGVGAIDVSFKGPFDKINMIVNATAGQNSFLYIPISSTQYGYDESFIVFDYQKEEKDSSTVERLVERLKASGTDFRMNLSFEREAEVQIIYDEETSNLLIGHGDGDLRIAVTRDGDFTIFGQYNVTSGEYLYTSYGFIAKPFIVEQGGTVTWTGDPINAILDVRAYYPNLRAPLNQFLQEYIDVAGTLSESDFRQRRNVDLDLILTGNLFNPDIDFDISFPNLIGELRTLAESKVRALQSTENGINNQVVGLMVFNNFLPDNDPFASLQASSFAQAGGNTITEFLTSQISVMATEYLSKLVEGGIISDIDLDINLAQNNSIVGVDDPNAGFVEFVPDEYQLNVRNEFKNDNFVLNLGGNYVRENALNSANNYLTGDFSLDWYITDDKRLRLQFYGVYDYDETAFARRQKYGFGINYQREFGTLSKESLEDVLKGIVEEVTEEAERTEDPQPLQE